MGKHGIPGWPESERPRERMIFQSEKALTDSELVALLLGNGSQNVSAVDLARTLLKKYESFAGLSDANLSELMKINGIGAAKATRLKACFEIHKRMKKQKIRQKKRVFCAKDVFDFFEGELSEAKEESTAVVFLDKKNQIISESVSKGRFDSTTINPRSLVQEALKHGAAGIIICHNHPSQNVAPTDEDKKTTAELKKLLEKLEITLVDHVILAKNRYYSFVESHAMD
ncbi:MAG: DNA repair protein RadC [Candidatus Diapherotrites archaeon]|nr:DNA repair protein RadC [Candidatus Diapherotrites archaeon]